jgi:PHD/YefM family antitoxin component YafN of YafNO toxin-antitoxin module
MSAKEQYVVDQNGNRTAVLLDVKYYHELLAALEEIESIRAYDEAKASDDEVILFSQATEEIERQRQ